MAVLALMTDALLDRCIAGERQAWRELHQHYYATVNAFLRHLGVRGADVEDACQDVFVQIFRYLATFQRRADLKTWVYKLCVSQAARVRRRAALHAALKWVVRDQDPFDASAGPVLTEDESVRRVRAALSAMKEIHRVVFVLYEMEGLSGKEVAAVTGLPPATVRRRLHDARRAFQQSLNPIEGAG